MEVNIDDAREFVGNSKRSQLFHNNMFVFLELTTQKKNIRNFTVALKIKSKTSTKRKQKKL